MPTWKFVALDPEDTVEIMEFMPLQSLWLLKRAASGGLPSWRDFAPQELKAWMGNLAVLDAPNAARQTPLRDFRYRLWGTRLTELFGSDLTGRLLDEAGYGAHEPRMRQLFETVTNGQIAMSSGSVYWQGRGYRRFRSIFLPLSTNRSDIDQILGVSIEVDAPRKWAAIS
jgi:hypothetical protein